MKLVKLQAEWCQPCKSLSSVMRGLDHPLVDSMETIDIDKDRDKAIMYGVRSIPTLVLLDDGGKELRRRTGMATTEQLLEFLS